jgi:hypothetical protein
LERLLLGLMSRANYTDSGHIEYIIKGENEPRINIYQILKHMDIKESKAYQKAKSIFNYPLSFNNSTRPDRNGYTMGI